MKKFKGVLAVLIVIAIAVTFCYLLYKTWSVFGFWTLIWTGLLTTSTGNALGYFMRSRKEDGNTIMFNPKEWPKFLNILVCVLCGYYLYTIISRDGVSKSDYLFGLFYLIILTALPIVLALYKLIRDRNDFVKIEGNILSFRDNSETGQVDLSKVVEIEELPDLRLKLSDATVTEIKLTQMNFDAIDRLALLADIKSRIPKLDDKKDETVSTQ